MADLTPLNLTDSPLETFHVFALFQAISIQKTSLAFLLQTLLTNLNFHIAKYFVYQTLYNFKLRGMK